MKSSLLAEYQAVVTPRVVHIGHEQPNLRYRNIDKRVGRCSSANKLPYRSQHRPWVNSRVLFEQPTRPVRNTAAGDMSIYLPEWGIKYCCLQSCSFAKPKVNTLTSTEPVTIKPILGLSANFVCLWQSQSPWLLVLGRYCHITAFHLFLCYNIKIQINDKDKYWW